jgi:cysteate synthase
VNDKKIQPEAIVMLNITGGGEETFKAGKSLYYLQPKIVFDITPSLEKVDTALKTIFKK